MVVGVANRGGHFSPDWTRHFVLGLESGLDIANGLHERLEDIPGLAETASRLGRRLFDVRHTSVRFEVATGRKRQGKRLLTVGTDCSCGKMFTTLALEKALLDTLKVE